MKYAKLKFGTVTVYMPTDPVPTTSTGKGIRKTASATEKVTKIKAELEEMVFAVAGSLQEKLGKLPIAQAPSEIELSFSVGFSAELKAWVFDGKAENGISLKLVWKPLNQKP